MQKSAAITFGVFAVAMFAYWFGMWWTCRPSLALFCFGPFLPWFFTLIWIIVGERTWRMVPQLHAMRRRRVAWSVAACVAFLLAPYSFFRADNDVFALAVRGRIMAAGGPEAVVDEFAAWLSTLEASARQEAAERDGEINPRIVQLPFYDIAADAEELKRKPPDRVPPGLYSLRQDLAGGLYGGIFDRRLNLSAIAFPNFYTLEIAAPGTTPRPATWFETACGGRRELYPGIWLDIDFYNK